jgi:hypothetical protein
MPWLFGYLFVGAGFACFTIGFFLGGNRYQGIKVGFWALSFAFIASIFIWPIQLIVVIIHHIKRP